MPGVPDIRSLRIFISFGSLSIAAINRRLDRLARATPVPGRACTMAASGAAAAAQPAFSYDLDVFPDFYDEYVATLPRGHDQPEQFKRFLTYNLLELVSGRQQQLAAQGGSGDAAAADLRVIRVVDLATGTGAVVEEVLRWWQEHPQERAGLALHVTALDSSPAMLRRAQQKLSAAFGDLLNSDDSGVAVDWAAGRMQDRQALPPTLEEAVDLVTCVGGACHHLQLRAEQQQLGAQAARLLRRAADPAAAGPRFLWNKFGTLGQGKQFRKRGTLAKGVLCPLVFLPS